MSNIKNNSTSFNVSSGSEKKTAGPSVTVKTETAGKIGLFGAIGVIIGGVFGVGIFLKMVFLKITMVTHGVFFYLEE